MNVTGDMRVSDAEREQVAARLAAAHAEGRLTLVEYDERVRAAHGALVREDLAPLTVDLPAPAPAPAAPARSRRPSFPVPVGMMPFGMPCRRGPGGSVGMWAAASAVNVVIWVAVVLAGGAFVYPWWIWVAGPWGLVLAVGALSRRPARADVPAAEAVPALGSLATLPR